MPLTEYATELAGRVRAEGAHSPAVIAGLQAVAEPLAVHMRVQVEARDPQPVEPPRHRTAELEL